MKKIYKVVISIILPTVLTGYGIFEKLNMGILTDIKNNIGYICIITGIVAYLTVWLIWWIDSQNDKLKKHIDQNKKLIKQTNEQLNQRIDQTNERIDAKIKTANQRIDEENKTTSKLIDQTNELIDQTKKQINNRFDELNNNIKIFDNLTYDLAHEQVFTDILNRKLKSTDYQMKKVEKLK